MTPLLMLGIAVYGLPLAWWARQRGLALAGASFLLGAGAIALHLFALSVMGIAWTRTSLLLALVPLLIVAMVRCRAASGPAAVRPPWRDAGRATLAVDLVVLAAVAGYAVFALYAPPYEWDFYGVWGIRGRWFFDARGIDWTWLKTNASHPDYPLLLPLLYDFMAIVRGGWNDLAFGWIYVAFCGSFLLIARAHSNAWIVLAVVFPALNLWIGLGDAAVMAFGCAGLLFLRRGEYGVGAVMLGFAAWSKNEGLALIVAAAIALLIARRAILALWPAVLMIAPWIVTRGLLRLPTDLADHQSLSRVWQRLIHPAETWSALATAPPDQPYLWLVVLAIVVFFIRTAWQRERFLLLALVLQSGALVIPLFATPFDLAGHAQFSLNRIPHQIAPAAAFLAALLLMRHLQPTSAVEASSTAPEPLPEP